MDVISGPGVPVAAAIAFVALVPLATRLWRQLRGR